MPGHKLSLAAEFDYGEILGFIARDNPAAAKRVKAAFEDAFRKLAENPNMGHWRDDITVKPVRFWGIYSYQIVYNPESSPLHILRILSGYRDMSSMLDEEL